MSEHVPSVNEVMAMAKQLSPKDRARVLWRIAVTLENHLNTELIERETPPSEMCGGLDAATPWDKASVIWWLALTLEGDLKSVSSKPKETAPGTSENFEVGRTELEESIAEMRREAWANFPREEFYC